MGKQATVIEPLLDARDLVRARIFQDEEAVWRAARKRQLPHVRVGRRIKFEPEAVRQWVAGLRQGEDQRRAGADAESVG